MRTVQYFSDQYLEHCKTMTPDQILLFLEDYRKLQADLGPLQQINLRVPKNALNAFKAKAQAQGIPYQQKLRELLVQWALD